MGSLLVTVTETETAPIHQPASNIKLEIGRCRARKKLCYHGILVAELVRKVNAAMHPHHRIAAKRIRTHTFGSCKFHFILKHYWIFKARSACVWLWSCNEMEHENTPARQLSFRFDSNSNVNVNNVTHFRSSHASVSGQPRALADIFVYLRCVILSSK